MQEITLTVNKIQVYNEVAKTTAYTGAKQTTAEDTRAYERIFTTDDDRLMLERFWTETANAVTEQFKPFLVSVSDQKTDNGIHLDNDYVIVLEMGDRFDVNLTNSIESDLFCFFVTAIVSNWFKYTNKDEAEAFAKKAIGIMDRAADKVYHLKRPKRVKHNNS